MASHALLTPIPLPPCLSVPLKTVASLFGADADTELLWFKKDAFSSKSFDPESYITDLRRFVPFETLRAELRGHLGGLKNELVILEGAVAFRKFSSEFVVSNVK